MNDTYSNPILQWIQLHILTPIWNFINEHDKTILLGLIIVILLYPILIFLPIKDFFISISQLIVKAFTSTSVNAILSYLFNRIVRPFSSKQRHNNNTHHDEINKENNIVYLPSTTNTQKTSDRIITLPDEETTNNAESKKTTLTEWVQYINDKVGPPVGKWVTTHLLFFLSKKLQSEIEPIISETAWYAVGSLYALAASYLGVAVTAINVTYTVGFIGSRILRLFRFFRRCIPELPIWHFP